jgi:hypothetical protein
MNAERTLLQASMAACALRIDKPRQSVDRVRHLFPVTPERAAALTADEEESIDALILRYSQCVSMIQDQVFRGIALLEQEDLVDKSNRDKALLMEKLGAIQSAADFGAATLLRNKLAHHYPDQSQAQIRRVNLAFEESGFVISVISSIADYVQRKGLE